MRNVLVIIVSLLAAVVSGISDLRDEVFMKDEYQSGYLPVGDRNGRELFYVYLPHRYRGNVETENMEKRPIILWVSGAAGCSSEFSLFAENGPVLLSEAADGSIRRRYNDNAWTEVANMLYVDQPLGSGYSDFPSPEGARQYISNPDYVAKEIRMFLMNFLAKNPSLKDSELFIAGESHAAQYAPSIALFLTLNPIGFNLKGVLMGSPWVEPMTQYPAVADFLYERDLISPKMYQMASNAFETCTSLLREGRNALGLLECNLAISTLIGILGDINPRNVKTICKDGLKPSCYDTETIIRYLNSDLVKQQLGVTTEWKPCNPITQFSLLLNGEWKQTTEDKIARLLERGLRVLIYVGDDDALCNWKGIGHWVNNFSGEMKKYRDVYPRNFEIAGKKVGEISGADRLYFLRVFDSGYLPARDQPLASLEFVSQFLSGEMSEKVQTNRYANQEFMNVNRPYFMAKRVIY